ncbi:hypothetical protein Tco_1429102 [Tanacetum coccineum]
MYPNSKTVFQRCQTLLWDDPSCLNYVRINDPAVCARQDCSRQFSKLATMDHRGHTVQISPPKRSLMPASFGLQYTKMTELVRNVIVPTQEKFHKGMRCLHNSIQCMRTRSSLEYTIPRRRNRRRSRQQQEAIPLILDPIPMADDRPMAEQLQAPTGGFESAIVVPPINAQNFELKSSLINLVQNRIFRGGNDEEPHAHIRHFESITNS